MWLVGSNDRWYHTPMELAGIQLVYLGSQLVCFTFTGDVKFLVRCLASVCVGACILPSWSCDLRIARTIAFLSDLL